MDCKHEDVFFRDQTILQFGDCWNLLASFVLLNPGSASPLDDKSQTEFLRKKQLPFFVAPRSDQDYLEFKVDQLMQNLLNLFAAKYEGGIIRLFNLFNLKDPKSRKAIKQVIQYQHERSMFSQPNEINYCSQPVVLAVGKKAFKHPRLTEELHKYIPPSTIRKFIDCPVLKPSYMLSFARVHRVTGL